MEDQPADSGDLTTGEPDKPRRRLRFGRRRRAEDVVEAPIEAPADEGDAESGSESGAESDPESDEATATSERRTPVGKTRRKASTEPEGEAAPENEAAPEGEATSEGESSSEASIESDSEPESGTEMEADGETEVESEAVDAEAEPAEDVILVPHRQAGRRLTYFAAGAAAVFVVACAFGGAMLQPYLADRALVATKLQVARTSADAITTLWTYNPDNIETLPDRASKYLSSGFADQYRQLIDSIVPTNKQAQVTNNTEVMGTAVETISRDEATAIVYTNTVSTSPVTKNVPSLRYMSYRLTLQRTDGDWRITQMPALTQLDLSPQL
ncbi:mammalian cell entry protein [Mycolicibacterium setense]|uniref:mammalian cell entry protein n=1 Tax=Mycolicibacterium setense TaxID=431269 RepID=UPI0005735E25|nr:mammalian cell entry protein [Mycolicibacterium setense]KHO25829.1 mammalian cell entry protein [Mycolicibacterium setense]MCV7110686.1 mammalian cell entry protein [Mycolicibacterium setense]